MTWMCQCGQSNGIKRAWCLGCGVHYSKTKWTKPRARSISRKKANTEGKDPLKPFTPASPQHGVPWTASTPSRGPPTWSSVTSAPARGEEQKVVAPTDAKQDGKEKGSNPPQASQGSDLSSQSEAILKALGSSCTPEMKAALEKMAELNPKPRLTHSHLSRVEKAKKNMETLRERIRCRVGQIPKVGGTARRSPENQLHRTTRSFGEAAQREARATQTAQVGDAADGTRECASRRGDRSGKRDGFHPGPICRCRGLGGRFGGGRTQSLQEGQDRERRIERQEWFPPLAPFFKADREVNDSIRFKSEVQRHRDVHFGTYGTLFEISGLQCYFVQETFDKECDYEIDAMETKFEFFAVVRPFHFFQAEEHLVKCDYVLDNTTDYEDDCQILSDWHSKPEGLDSNLGAFFDTFTVTALVNLTGDGEYDSFFGNWLGETVTEDSHNSKLRQLLGHFIQCGGACFGGGFTPPVWPAPGKGIYARETDWRVVVWDDEVIAFFFGLMMVMGFCWLCLLLLDALRWLGSRWRSFVTGAQWERSMVVICRRRCCQRKKPRVHKWNTCGLALRYLMLWHLWSPLVLGKVERSSMAPDFDALGGNGFDGDDVLTRSHHGPIQEIRRVLTRSPFLQTSFERRLPTRSSLIHHGIIETVDKANWTTWRDGTDGADSGARNGMHSNEDSADPGEKNCSNGRAPCNAREGSDLQRRIDTTLQQNALYHQRLRDQAEDHTWVWQQTLISEEALALARHRPDGRVLLMVFGILERQTSVEEIWINTLEMVDFLDVLVEIRQRWVDVRRHLDAELLFVELQPQPFVYEGKEAVSLIMDMLPGRYGVPILVTTSVLFPWADETFDTSTYRTDAAVTCRSIQRLTGMVGICSHNAVCHCTLGVRSFDAQPVFVHGGNYIVLKILFGSVNCLERGTNEQVEGDEDTSLMQAGEIVSRGRRHEATDVLPTWVYGYCLRWSQPLRMWRGAAAGRPLARFLAGQYSYYEGNTQVDDVVVFKVFPQPCAVEDTNIEYYVIARRVDLNAFLTLVLASIDWLAPASGDTGAMPSTLETWKSAKAVDFHVDRQTLLGQIGLGAWCAETENHCQLFVRGSLWEESDTRLRRIVEGDFIQIKVPVQWPDIPLLVQWRLVSEGCSLRDLPNRHGDADNGGEVVTTTVIPSSNATIDYQTQQEGDTTGLMQNTLRVGWFYLYRVGTDEPDAEKIVGNDLLGPKRVIDQRLRQRDPDWRANPGRIFFVSPTPPDLARHGVTAVLLSRAEDVGRGTSIVMVDVEIPGDTILAPAGEWREVALVDASCTREQFIHQMDLNQYCDGEDNVCEIFHAGELWGNGDDVPRFLMCGDFLAVKVSSTRQESGICSDLGGVEDIDRPQQSPEHGDQGELEDVEIASDSHSLLQVGSRLNYTLWRPSSTRVAWSRIPPPGNGTRKVAFSHLVEDDEGGCFENFSICNQFVQDFFCNGHSLDNPNRYFGGLVEDLTHRELPDRPLLPVYAEDGPLPVDESRRRIEIANGLSRDNVGWKASHGLEVGPFEGVELRDVWDFRLWFEGHCTMPTYDLDGVRWHPKAWDWLTLPVWCLQQPLELHFFVDGSTKGGRSGSACVLFVWTCSGWFFGGFVRNSTDTKGDSFQAELEGNLMASKWAFDLLKILEWNGMSLPNLVMHYDCVSAAKTVEGMWKGNSKSGIFIVARSIQHVLWQCFGKTFCIIHEKGHKGNPGNEAADSAAFSAVDMESGDAFWDAIVKGQGLGCVQWLWLLYRRDLDGYWRDGHLLLPKPIANLDQGVLKELSGGVCGRARHLAAKVELNLVSYNVMTLGENKPKRGPVGEIESVLRQGAEGDYHVLALQETRLKRSISRANAWYFCFSTPPSPSGDGGMLIAFRKDTSFGYTPDGKTLQWKEGDFKLIFGDERSIILRVVHPALKVIFIAAHAPHTGNEPEVIDEWWATLWNRVPGKYKDLPVIFMGDANSRVGNMTSRYVHDGGAEQENVGGEAFHKFLMHAGVWLPSTWKECHQGPHFTWIHPRGATSRLDYVGLPVEWKNAEVRSRVSDLLCVSNCLWDHRPVEVRLKMEVDYVEDPDWKNLGKTASSCKGIGQEDWWKLRQELGHLPVIRWDIDVHRHVLTFQKRVHKITKAYMSKKQGPRKDYLDDETWTMVKTKKNAKNAYFLLQDEIRLLSLGECFHAWKFGNPPLERHQLDGKIKELAMVERNYRKACIKAQTMIRRADNAFFDSFSKRLEACDSSQLQRQLWKEVKRYLPVTKAKKKMLNASNRDVLVDKWAPYLCGMEAGTVSCPEETYRGCINKQNLELPCSPDRDGLPTLIELEHLMLSTNPNRCGGPDGIGPDIVKQMSAPLAPHLWDIAFKQMVWQTEPVFWKGGILKMIPRGSGLEADPAKYRGIMLTPVFGKKSKLH